MERRPPVVDPAAAAAASGAAAAGAGAAASASLAVRPSGPAREVARPKSPSLMFSRSR